MIYVSILRKNEDATKQIAINALNRTMGLKLELAGVLRYTHYSLMAYGYNPIPIVSWLKANALEGLVHAHNCVVALACKKISVTRF